MTSTLPQEYDPDAAEKAASKLRGQIFAVGLSFAWALVFLVLGTCLFVGVELLTSIWITIASFAVVVVLAFFAEVIVEPSLADVARRREEARIAREREEAPTAGGVMSARVPLIGGADESHPNVAHARPAGAVGGAAGRVGGGVGGGSVGGGAVGAAGAAGAAGAGQRGRRLDVTLPEEHSSPPRAGTPGQEEGFQDLASLLKEASQPSPVPVRQR